MSQETSTYEILYHPTIPGRAEFIRLFLEATGTPYTDLANSTPEGYTTVQTLCTNRTPTPTPYPPIFAPPALRITTPTTTHLLSQTPNILRYLAQRTGLVPADGISEYHVEQIALTALDLANEIHDSHHPLSVFLYYADQKPAALQKATDLRTNRIPKFFAYFENCLTHNLASGGGEGKYFVGTGLTYADTTVWQVVDGLMFAFPREMGVRRGEFPGLFGFYEGLKGEGWLRGYLGSERRLPYGLGLFRCYPELDRA